MDTSDTVQASTELPYFPYMTDVISEPKITAMVAANSTVASCLRWMPESYGG
jgi:hypothetical protein